MDQSTPGPWKDIGRTVAMLLGPVMPFVVESQDWMTFSPAGENERLLLAWLYLMYGCTIAGPVLGLVSAMRFIISPGKPVWVRAVSLPWALLNALVLFIFYYLHQRL